MDQNLQAYYWTIEIKAIAKAKLATPVLSFHFLATPMAESGVAEAMRTLAKVFNAFAVRNIGTN